MAAGRRKLPSVLSVIATCALAATQVHFVFPGYGTIRPCASWMCFERSRGNCRVKICGDEGKLDKYQCSTGHGFQGLEPEALKDFGRAYHTVKVPFFLRNFFSLEEFAGEHKAFLHCPELFRFRQVGPDRQGFVIMPHSKKRCFAWLLNSSEAERKQMKNMEKTAPEGISFIVWYVHPGIAEKPDVNLFRLEDFPKVRDCKRRGETQEVLSEDTVGAVDANWSIPEFDKEGPTYLASPYDLTAQDLPFLDGMRNDVQKLLQDEFGYKIAEDCLHLYLHCPYDEKTTTLHLHLRLGFHCPRPIEDSKSVSIHEVISHLRDHEDMTSFLGGRERRMLVRESCPQLIAQTIHQQWSLDRICNEAKAILHLQPLSPDVFQSIHKTVEHLGAVATCSKLDNQDETRWPVPRSCLWQFLHDVERDLQAKLDSGVVWREGILATDPPRAVLPNHAREHLQNAVKHIRAAMKASDEDSLPCFDDPVAVHRANQVIVVDDRRAPSAFERNLHAVEVAFDFGAIFLGGILLECIFH